MSVETSACFRAEISYGLSDWKILSEHKIKPQCWQKECRKHAGGLLQNECLQNVTTAANFGLLVLDASDMQIMKQLRNSCPFNREMKREKILKIRHTDTKVYLTSFGQSNQLQMCYPPNKTMPLNHLQSLMPSLSMWFSRQMCSLMIHIFTFLNITETWLNVFTTSLAFCIGFPKQRADLCNVVKQFCVEHYSSLGSYFDLSWKSLLIFLFASRTSSVKE